MSGVQVSLLLLLYINININITSVIAVRDTKHSVLLLSSFLSVRVIKSYNGIGLCIP